MKKFTQKIIPALATAASAPRQRPSAAAIQAFANLLAPHPSPDQTIAGQPTTVPAAGRQGGQAAAHLSTSFFNQSSMTTPPRPDFNNSDAKVEQAVNAMIAEVGAPDGDMGMTITHFNDAVIEAQYLRGVEDALAARAKGEDPVNYYVAGSGNTQADADERAKQAADTMGGTWKGIKGANWSGNFHQVAGTGIGNTEQTSDVAYALGRCHEGRIFTHSQGDLSTLTAINSLKDKYPEVLSTEIISFGSPLMHSYTKNAIRVTGKSDVIRYGRGLASIVFGEEYKKSTDLAIPGGHESDNYMKNLDVVKSSLPAPSRPPEKERE